MGHGRPLFLIAIVFMHMGCHAPNQTRSASFLDRMRSWTGPTGPDVVQVEIAILERPIDDKTFDEQIWHAADEQILSLEKKSLLEEHGFRIGQLGGMKPPALQQLLTSDKAKFDRQRFLRHSGKSLEIKVGPTMPLCSGTWKEAPDNVMQLEQAECRLIIVPSITPDGMTKLEFLPSIRHGETILTPRAADDGSGFVLLPERPSKNLTPIAFTVNLGPNQYLLIGALPDQADTMGGQFFHREKEPRPMQRLLVLRTHIPNLEPEDPWNDPLQPSRDPGGSTPLAAQAAQSR